MKQQKFKLKGQRDVRFIYQGLETGESTIYSFSLLIDFSEACINLETLHQAKVLTFSMRKHNEGIIYVLTSRKSLHIP